MLLLMTNPLTMENIKEQQDTDDALLQHATKYTDQYMHKHVGTIDDILCYRLVWAKKVTLAAICLEISSASFGIRIN